MPATYVDLLAKAHQIFEDAKVILENDDASQEEKNRVPVMIEDAKKLKERAMSLKEVEELAQETGAAGEPLPGGSKQASRAGKQAPATEEEFKSWYDFVMACKKVHEFGRRDARLKTLKDPEEDMAEGVGREAKTMSGSSGAAGGFLIPPEFYEQIMAVAATVAIVRGRATVLPMSKRTLGMPILDQTGSTAGTPSWFGGLLAYWQEEGSQKTESDPDWRRAMLTAHKLIVYSVMDDELMEDAPALSSWLQGPLGIPGVIAWKEDYAFLQGNGVGQPQGVISAPATKVVARQTASSIDYTDLTNMLAGVWGNDANIVWVASISAKAKLLQMSGPSGNPSYLWGNAENGMPRTLLGYPIFWTDKSPALGTQGDIGLFDFTYYLIGDRKATEIRFSEHENFKYDRTSLRGVHRVDGQPWLSSVITLVDGSTTVSPFVVLGDAST